MSTFNENGFSIKEQILAIVAGLLIVAIAGWFLPVGSGSFLSSGASGTQYVEDYDPLVMQAGFHTLKAASFGSTLNVTGATSFAGAMTLTSTFKVGTNGSTITELKSTTCNIATYELPLDATSTDAFYCAITGLASGDQVFVTLPSDNASATGGFQVSYAKASTTPDGAGVEIGIMNSSGAATSTFPLATTSVQVLYVDN